MLPRLLVAAALAAVILPAFAAAQKYPKKPTPIGPPGAAAVDDPTTRRPREFENVELSTVLRLLARQARINLIIAEEVLAESSTVTTRLENVTALETIKAITNAKGLRLEKKGDVYHVDVLPERRAELAAEKKKAGPEDEMQKFFDRLAEGLTGERMTRALTSQAERLLAWEADPANAVRIAKARKVLLDALLAEGFSREEAMRIVERHQMAWALPGFNSR